MAADLLVKKELVVGWKAIGRVFGVNQQTIRRWFTRVGLVPPLRWPQHAKKGMVAIPKIHIKLSLYRLERSDCKIPFAKREKVRYNVLHYLSILQQKGLNAEARSKRKTED